MNLNTVFGTKIGQTQGFLENGKRVPLSCIHVEGSTVTQVKTDGKDGYTAAQMAFGIRNKISKSTQGHIKKAKLTKKPRFFREVRLENIEGLELGTEVKLEEVLKPGDIIAVTGTSKGKGYAGVVKRHGFAGGPRTHGQSDRERAPGSIGQSTTPGRVYKGKKMAGRMGNEQVTVRNLIVIDIDGDTLFVKGLIPGGKGGVIKITKMGEMKNFVPLYKEDKSEEAELDAKASEAQSISGGEKKAESVAPKSEEAEEKISTEEEAKKSESKEDKEADEKKEVKSEGKNKKAQESDNAKEEDKAKIKTKDEEKKSDEKKGEGENK